MSKVVIVGAGLFGSIAAAVCHRAGHDVTVIDDLRPGAASLASGCLMRRSWFSGLDTVDVQRGYMLLDELYGVKTVHLKNLGLIRGATYAVQFVDPDKILGEPYLEGRVKEVRDGMVQLEDGSIFKGKVLIAAGCYAGELVEMPPIQRLVGISMRFKGQLVTSRMRTYAPYRQAIAFNINEGEVWFGDGTSILQKNFVYSERFATAKMRAETFFGLKFKKGTRVDVGYRPYVKGYKAGYFSRVSENTWVSTGGAKNGTLLAAIQALKFLEAI